MSSATHETFSAVVGVRMDAERHALASRWLERLVATIPVERDDVFPTETLLDHIPHLIEQIAKSLVSDDYEIAANTFVIAKARELGELRHMQRASVHQLLHEYELLRSILETFVGEEAAGLGLAPAFMDVLHAVQQINRAVALLTQTTVDTFVERFTATIEDQTKRLAAFNTMVSHELRQPLGALQTGAALLRKTAADLDTDRQQRLVAALERNIARLVELVTTITRVTGGQAADEKPGIQQVSLTTIAQEAARQLREMAGSRDVQIRIAPDLPDVIVDVGRLELMLTNLISNAIKYADPAKGERWVDVAVLRRNEAGYCTFCVRDNGLGMTTEQAQQVFTPFYRAHAHTGVDGMGLGLAIVRDCTEAIGASITVDSVPGEGTTFAITLPIGVRAQST